MVHWKLRAVGGNINGIGDGQVCLVCLRGQEFVAEKSSMLILNE